MSLRARHVFAIAAALTVAACAGAGADGDEETIDTSEAALGAQHVLETPPAVATTEETYYALFFSYQSAANLITRQNSHTFAQFVRATPDGASGASGVAVAESVVISWMPASGAVRVLGPPEPGENTGIDFEMSRGASVWRARAFGWGPYRVPKAVWTRAVAQRDLLASGRVAYRAFPEPAWRNVDYLASGGTPAPPFLNCLAAVGDVVPGGGTPTGTSSGRAGTQEIVDHFTPSIIDRPANYAFHDRHRWLSQRLNIGRFNPYFARQIELQEQRGRN